MAMLESPLMVEMKPVVLGNDEYDEDMTFLKEVAHSEFESNQESKLVNVSDI